MYKILNCPMFKVGLSHIHEHNLIKISCIVLECIVHKHIIRLIFTHINYLFIY